MDHGVKPLDGIVLQLYEERGSVEVRQEGRAQHGYEDDDVGAQRRRRSQVAWKQSKRYMGAAVEHAAQRSTSGHKQMRF